MVVYEVKQINEKYYDYHYSDQGFYIERDGVKYAEAIDPFGSGREYTESNKKIEENVFD